MSGLYGASVQMALMSQVFLPKVHVGTSKTLLSVTVCEENQLTDYKNGKTGQMTLDDLLVKLSLGLCISESKQFYMKTCNISQKLKKQAETQLNSLKYHDLGQRLKRQMLA